MYIISIFSPDKILINTYTIYNFSRVINIFKRNGFHESSSCFDKLIIKHENGNIAYIVGKKDNKLLEGVYGALKREFVNTPCIKKKELNVDDVFYTVIGYRISSRNLSKILRSYLSEEEDWYFKKKNFPNIDWSNIIYPELDMNIFPIDDNLFIVGYWIYRIKPEESEGIDIDISALVEDFQKKKQKIRSLNEIKDNNVLKNIDNMYKMFTVIRKDT